MKRLTIALLPLGALALIAGCSHWKSGAMGLAVVVPTTNQTAKGMVHFMDMNDGSTEVSVDLTGLAPGSTHGFHVHEKGDCSNDAQAAGGHFNPTGAQHGAPDAASHHAGDFGNVTADEKGEVHTKFMTKSVTVKAGPTSVIGHAVVVHANPDDLTSQPSGNAGARIACGIVQPMTGDMAGGMHH
jgi:Cu-Zn family superoxide dismutase